MSETASVIVPDPPRKRLFLGLLVATLGVLVGAGLYGWFLIRYAHSPLNQAVIAGLGIAFVVVVVLASFGIAGMVLTILKHRAFPSLQRWMIMVVHLLFPLALALARILRIRTDRVRSSFIQVSNALVRARRLEVAPDRLLILTPHCLQRRECRHKVTVGVANCARCGRCPIDGLLGLAKRYGIQLAVVPGGTLARKVVKELRPQAVVAVACERDLTSEIQDMAGIPVLGVLNERPQGPCANTLVQLADVEEAVRYFLP